MADILRGVRQDSILHSQKNEEPLNSQVLKATSAALRELANLIDSLALANSGGYDADLLKGVDVMRLLHVSASKACEIIRIHGVGSGKMGRIERGVLMKLMREGRL